MAIATYLQGRGRRQGAASLVHSATSHHAHHQPELYLQCSAEGATAAQASSCSPKAYTSRLAQLRRIAPPGLCGIPAAVTASEPVDTRDKVTPRSCQALITEVLVKLQCKFVNWLVSNSPLLPQLLVTCGTMAAQTTTMLCMGWCHRVAVH